MKLEKILEALDRVDELGQGLQYGCAVNQLFMAAGKTCGGIEFELKKHIASASRYPLLFDKLLNREYGLSNEEISDMWQLNDFNGIDCPSETKCDRHKRVRAHYENLLIEELVACSTNASQSSYHQEEDLNRSEDVSTQQSPMLAKQSV